MYSNLLNTIGLMSPEERYFSLLLVHGPFERRLYQMSVSAKLRTEVRDDMNFDSEIKSLQEYAIGNNFKVERIQPVGPLCIQWAGEKNEISLVLPFNRLDREIPEPINRSIHLELDPPRQFCSLRFRGVLSQEIVDQKKEQLLRWIQYKGLKSHGDCRVLINSPDAFFDFFKTYDIQIEVR